MTENKRFTITQDFEEHHRQIRDNGHIIMGCFIEPQAEVIVDLLNELNDENEKLKQSNQKLNDELQETMGYLALKSGVEKENEQLKSENRGLQSELQIFKEDVIHSNLQINKLADENEQLKSRVEYLERKIDRERTSYQKQHEKWEEEIQKAYVGEMEDYLARLEEKNEQLKVSSTMYYELFKELQRQMQDVKSIYDLDSKDFEDLIKLSKGNVFDDEIGWIHLPIEELQE